MWYILAVLLVPADNRISTSLTKPASMMSQTIHCSLDTQTYTAVWISVCGTALQIQFVYNIIWYTNWQRQSSWRLISEVSHPTRYQLTLTWPTQVWASKLQVAKIGACPPTEYGLTASFTEMFMHVPGSVVGFVLGVCFECVARLDGPQYV